MELRDFNVEVLKEWLNGDPYRTALLIKETPISGNTLRNFIYGQYKPSPLMVRALVSVMNEHPLKRGKPVPAA